MYVYAKIDFGFATRFVSVCLFITVNPQSFTAHDVRGGLSHAGDE
jgi:hypothetical protein